MQLTDSVAGQQNVEAALTSQGPAGNERKYRGRPCASCCSFPANLTQPWKFLNTSVRSSVAYTASIFLHYGHARSRRRASARRGEALMNCTIKLLHRGSSCSFSDLLASHSSELLSVSSSFSALCRYLLPRLRVVSSEKQRMLFFLQPF